MAGPRFGMATSCLTPCWTLLQNNTALWEGPKVAAVEKEAPSHACTHRLRHHSQHRLGQPHTVLRREQKISSGDRPGLQPNQHFWGDRCC